jgi:hypothetical protein
MLAGQSPAMSMRPGVATRAAGPQPVDVALACTARVVDMQNAFAATTRRPQVIDDLPVPGGVAGTSIACPAHATNSVRDDSVPAMSRHQVRGAWKRGAALGPRSGGEALPSSQLPRLVCVSNRWAPAGRGQPGPAGTRRCGIAKPRRADISTLIRNFRLHLSEAQPIDATPDVSARLPRRRPRG